MPTRLPQRIICMTEESTETLYLLGEQDRIVGISGFTVRPPEARENKPVISAFTTAKIDKILELKPDLVLGFSDIQADIAKDLIRAGLNVYIFNQRSIPEILGMIQQLGAIVGASEKAGKLIAGYEKKIKKCKQEAENQTKKPLVYFEEWYDPIITGIQWVAELIEIAGGKDCFPEHFGQSLAKNRILADPLEAARRKPDIIMASWCGKKFDEYEVYNRPGWENIPALKNNQVFEIKSELILQPGPACLSDGLDQVKMIIDNWRHKQDTL